MTYFQLELVIFFLSSFILGVLIGLLFSIFMKETTEQKKKTEKCPWCGKFKSPGKICKCEE